MKVFCVIKKLNSIRFILFRGIVCVYLAVFFQVTCAESLYQEEKYKALTSDNRAFSTGDALTVQVFENTSANSSVNTGNQRGNNMGASINRSGGRSVGQADLSVRGDFDGGGRTQRASRLLATLTVSVRDVLPNGDLMIAGEQLLLVNDEQQKVKLEGRVRPIDVSDGNVVLSTRIADARITYIGEGDLSERSKRAWWRKFLDAVGL